MHTYSIDSDERRNLTLAVGALGVAAAYLTNGVLRLTDATVPWWFDAPAVFGFAVLFYGVLDRWVWRWSLLRRVGVVAAPDLSGTWRGHLESHGSDFSEPREVEMVIQQTWTRISLALNSPSSRSWSVSASISVASPFGAQIAYMYQNQPAAGSVDTMNAHYGTATHILDTNGPTLNGDYYTGRGRNTFGSIQLTRSSN